MRTSRRLQEPAYLIKKNSSTSVIKPGPFDRVFRRSPLFFFAIFLSHVVGSDRISRELNIGAGSSLDSAGNAALVVFWVQFRRN